MRNGARTKWRGPARALRWIGALAVVGIAAVGALELYLRAFPQHLPPAMLFRLHEQATGENELRSRPHEEIGYLWQPNIRDTFGGFEFDFTYTTDEHGFRNPEPWPDEADVVVLGDSQAFGFGVEDREAWARHMAEGLPQAEVVNLALIGAAPQQFLEVYEAYGRRLRPEVVVVALFPPNAIGMGRLFAEWVGDGKPDRFDLRKRNHAFGAADGVLGTIKDQLRDSYAVLGLYYGLKDVAGTSELITMTFDEGERIRLVPTRYGNEAALAGSRHADFELTIRVLERLHAAVRADGAELVVVPFPTKEEVLLPLLGEPANALVAPFIVELEQRGIPSLDLTPFLRERAARGEKLFFEIDLHPNEAGQQLIADVLIEYLERRVASVDPPS